MKTMRARYTGICPSCDGRIFPGEMIDYDRGIRARHSVCPEALASLRAEAFEASELAAPGYATGCDSDHPRVRAGHRCPVCGRAKDRGCLVCWPCYRKHDFRNGPALAIEDLIEEAELSLAGDAYGRPENFRK